MYFCNKRSLRKAHTSNERHSQSVSSLTWALLQEVERDRYFSGGTGSHRRRCARYIAPAYLNSGGQCSDAGRLAYVHA